MTTRRRVHRPLAFFVGLLAAELAAIGNALGHDMLRRAFATQQFKQALQPVISMEEFNAGPRNRVAHLDYP